MRLGIDASGLRSRSGIATLGQMLRHGNPESSGIQRVVVWGGREVLAALPEQPWLDAIYFPELNCDSPQRLQRKWSRRQLGQLAADACDVLLVPSGVITTDFHPVVVMIPGMGDAGTEGWSQRPWLRSVVRGYSLWSQRKQASQQADGIIVPGRQAMEWVNGQSGEANGRITLIRPGVEPEYLQAPRPPRSRDELTAGNPFRIVALRGGVGGDYCSNVVRAAHALRQQGVPVKLDLLTAGNEPVASRSLQRAMLEFDSGGEWLVDHGPVDASRERRLLRDAELFVTVARGWAASAGLLRAMAAGLPIASSSFGSTPEEPQSVGACFDPCWPEHITAAISSLINDDRSRSASANAAFEQAQAWTWQRNAEQTFAFCTGVAARMSRLPHDDRQTEPLSRAA